MKRLLALLMIFCLLFSGCNALGEGIKEPVTFYYLKTEYQYFAQDGVIGFEEKEASGHRDDLSYLMALYLMGPSRDDLKSPVPKGTRIYFSQETAGSISLKLSDTTQTLNELEFSMACACLSMTCFGLSDADTITIVSGERSITVARDGMILFDGSDTLEVAK